MERPWYDTVILSDLHLGSETSRADEALEVLQSLRFRRLILLGDIFCDLNFGRLKKHHWNFLSYIRKLSNPKRGVEVVWVEGNHDHGLAEVMSHLVGIRVYEEYTWNHAGHRHLAIHGHQFDSVVINDFLGLSSFGARIFLVIQKLDSRRKRFARVLDRLSTRWLRLTPKVSRGAIARAREMGATRVFCGHTHQPLTLVQDGIRYFNTGAWTTSRPTFVTVAGEEIKIHEHVTGIDDRRPGEERGSAAAAPVGLPASAGLPADAEYESVYC